MFVISQEQDLAPASVAFEPVKLRGLSDAELRAAHHRAQIDCVFNHSMSFMARLNAIERELLSRRLPCR